ncbi:rRNA-processing protein FYV7 [Dioscorea cayenensis subsp. rotundata]|uniref:rRNA-processing protein FYV7 n=1 Tax=Dioscorea cayennensis subsp. rotundata TaxID=55577 RepID=A0AB40C7B7_DIOCR|nr:rRNA-processing protein FYV7 [Dioscorea cayenensis subsp. rotundata]XP_039135683.1 rRNA-processing protein FYV7 [Dioscorea cayenensis subsp. rotundata]
MKSNREFHKNEGDEVLQMGNRSNAHKYKKTNRKRNEKRLGGRGLSLEAFANAKSGPSGYNPSIIKKQREFYRNAKFVSKYKKLVQDQSQSGNHLSLAPKLEDDDEGENEMDLSNRRNNKKNKKKNNLQSVREEFEKKQAEKEKARMEKEALMQAKKEERARAEAKRKTLRENMFKRTRSGQPVMKYRVSHLLEGITENSLN